MVQLSKSLFIKGHDCCRASWLTAWRPDLKPEETLAAQMRSRMGQSLGELARRLYPGGVLCWQPGMIQEDSVLLTAAYKESKAPLFEAAFERGGLFARADILEPTEAGWFLWEVKSSTNPKDRHFIDLAFQWSLMESCGWKVAGAGLILVDTSWTWEGDGQGMDGLFRKEDVTRTVLKAKEGAEQEIPVILAALQEDAPPSQVRKKACRDCDYLDHCFPDLTGSDILFLGYVKDPQIADWERRGLTLITHIPEDELPRKDQRELKRLLSTTGLTVADDLAQELAKITLPACFVDFETDASAIPWLAGANPYQSVPFQQAIVMVHSWSEEPERVDFLWDSADSSDPRPSFVQSLLEPFSQAESIIHYSSAEITQLRKLSEQRAPGADAALLLLQEKGVDLEKIVKGRVQHPDLGTRTTIKKVLPVLCPELAEAYSSMEVSDGDMAMAVFQRIRSGRLVKEEEIRLRQALIDYCHLDSVAMVEVARALRRLAGL